MGMPAIVTLLGRRKEDPSVWCLGKERPLHAGRDLKGREGRRAGDERNRGVETDSQPLPNIYLLTRKRHY